MEVKTDALLLRSADYGENDKIVTLLTADRGKIAAAMKGVKKAGAKLRFAAQPFCFAEYVLAERGGRRTVISASLHDGFFALRESITAFYAASTVAEASDKLVFEGMDGGELLICAVSALKALCEGDPSPALLQFLLNALRIAGYPLRAEKCPFCGRELHREARLRFDMESGSFACEACGKGTPASGVTYLTLRAALKGETFHEKDGEKRALKLLSAYFTYQTETELNALSEYIRIL